MTPEELLKPRYKVIADYPGNPYDIGFVIQMPENNRSFHLYTFEYTDDFGENVKQQTHVVQSIIDNYPHLFRRLEWWEERKVEDMPKYVKNKKGIILTVSSHFTDSIGNFNPKGCQCKETQYSWNFNAYYALLPAHRIRLRKKAIK